MWPVLHELQPFRPARAAAKFVGQCFQVQVKVPFEMTLDIGAGPNRDAPALRPVEASGFERDLFVHDLAQRFPAQAFGERP